VQRTLAEFAAGGAPLPARLRVARELARAAAALRRRGAVHGALAPGAVLVAGDGEAVALAPAATPEPLALAGWAAPELVRGGRPTRAADAFAAAALCQLALTGRGPFDGGEADPLERARRVLFEAPRPARLDAPEIPVAVEEVLARLLERSAGRRGTPEELDAVLAAAMGEGAVTSRGAVSSTSTTTSTTTTTSASASASAGAGAGSGATATATATWGAVLRAAAALAQTLPRNVLAAAARLLSVGRARLRRGTDVRSPRLAAALGALARRVPPSPLHRAALAAVPLLVAATLLLPPSGAALAREVGRAIAQGDLVAARVALDRAPRGADRGLVEKLRGDLACARRAPDECLRRYRTALAARPELRVDESLRRNVRALLSRDEACATQRSAALLAGQLRDPAALPALQAARRSAGFFGFLCAGDAFDRAIAATRASAR
jgi:hypothetical protein